MTGKAKWYVVHTYSGYENKVAATIRKSVENRGLEELIEDVHVPMETVTEIKDTGSRQVERKLFPGYVLIKMHMTDESWYIVRNTRGVTSFVGPGSKPVALTDEEVAALGVEKMEIKLSYGVGDSVKIIEGPLDGFIGVVDEIDTATQSVKVTVSMFGRETPVELQFGQVAALEK
ncbi:MAG: transcription termination/antitermination factor NusG [Clostridia bacterium]|nr:transcription termination/antitermination factor NusG [Clostridia bacterium]